jgi:hypothetical protein
MMVSQALQLSSSSRHTEAVGLNHLRLAGMLKEAGNSDAAATHFAAARQILGSIEFPAVLTEL